MNSIRPAVDGRLSMTSAARPPLRDLVFLLLVLVLVILLVVFLLVVFIVLVLQRIDVGTLENDKRKGFAEQVARGAHPEAFDRVIANFRNRQWLSAGLQHHDVAGLQFHDLFLRVRTCSRNGGSCVAYTGCKRGGTESVVLRRLHAIRKRSRSF